MAGGEQAKDCLATQICRRHVTTKTHLQAGVQVSDTLIDVCLWMCRADGSVAVRRKIRNFAWMIALFAAFAAVFLALGIPTSAGAILFGLSAVLLMGYSASGNR